VDYSASGLGLNEATCVEMMGVGRRSEAFVFEDSEQGKGGCVAASRGDQRLKW